MEDANPHGSAPRLERFVVIFADDCLPDKVYHDEGEAECLLLSTANVLAGDEEEAIVLASQAEFDGHHRAVAALTVGDLCTMAEALAQAPLDEERRVTFTIGGYATADRLTQAACRDVGKSRVLEV